MRTRELGMMEGNAEGRHRHNVYNVHYRPHLLVRGNLLSTLPTPLRHGPGTFWLDRDTYSRIIVTDVVQRIETKQDRQFHDVGVLCHPCRTDK